MEIAKGLTGKGYAEQVAGIAPSVTGVSTATPTKAPPGRITGFGGGGGGGFGPESLSPDKQQVTKLLNVRFL